MPQVKTLAHLVLTGFAITVLASCGGGGGGGEDTGSDPDGNEAVSPVMFTLEGQAVNAALDGATVDVCIWSGNPCSPSAGEFLGSAVTDMSGNFTVEVPHSGPYRVRVVGGTMNGEAYEGVLAAHCVATTTVCGVTPMSTTLLKAVDDHGFNIGDASALFVNRLGFAEDPFLTQDSLSTFSTDAARTAMNFGVALEEWAGALVTWIMDETQEPPPGVFLWHKPLSAEASGFTVWGGTWYTGPPELAIDSDPITAWTLNDMGTITFDLGADFLIGGIDAYWGGNVTNGNTVNVYVDGKRVVAEAQFGATSNVRLFTPVQGRYVTYETVALPHNQFLQIATWSEIAEFAVFATSSNLSD